MTTMPTLSPAQSIQTVNGPYEASRAVETIALAFSADPVARWIFPDAPSFTNAFPEFVHAFAGPALEQGTVHCTAELEGAAFWFAPGVVPDEKAILGVIERTVPGDLQPDVLAVFEQMDQFHPTAAHWYLPLLGVDPPHQGRGHGSALLRHVLRECDRTGLPAYLESSNAANLSLYERHGFRPLGRIQAGTSPILYPMQREPRATTLSPTA